MCPKLSRANTFVFKIVAQNCGARCADITSRQDSTTVEDKCVNESPPQSESR